MKPEQQKIAIAEICGWKRWAFGDHWVKGLKLADHRFGGYVRRVIQFAQADSQTVKLDIDESWTQQAVEIKNNYTPLSHWVRDKVIRSTLPDYLNDLNAMHEAEKGLTETNWPTYMDNLCAATGRKCELSKHACRRAVVHATASHRAEAFLKTMNKWIPTT